MSRPRLDIGTFGEIMTRKVAPGRVEARARYRDWDGMKRLVQATADTAAAATRRLRVKLAARDLLQPTHVGLSPDSLLAELAEYWLDDLRTEGRLSKATIQLYERDMRSLVLPSFANLTLREIGVARCDHFIKQLAKQSYSKAKHARVVLRLAFGLAVRHEILSRNPVDHVARLHRVAPIPDALTPQEVNAIRAAIALWEAGRDVSGPKPDGQLGAIIEVMLGTSARIGEALAIRRCDIDLAGPSPSIRICGTIVSHRGEPVMRQDHPKTTRSRRTIIVPEFTADAVQRRLRRSARIDPQTLLFSTREGTPLTTNNVRRQLRHVLDLAGISGVTPHMFRRTVATAVSQQAGVELAAELLGHADPRTTIRHYVRRDETVNPSTADLLDRAFGSGA